MSLRKRTLARVSFAALCAAITSETAAADGDSASPKPSGIETVVVTASKYRSDKASTGTKTDTPIMLTPMSIAVIPQQVLQDQQTLRLDDAIQNVSGVIPSNDSFGTGDSFTIRGFDQNDLTFEDGVKLDQYSISGFPRDLANIESIEVVKGPASVLYGQAEPGGLVSIVTKKPLDTPFYSLDQQVGSFGLYRTTADATGPLTQDGSLLYRFNLDFENAGSFRDFIHTHRLSLFPTLEWKPDDQDQLTLELKYGTGSLVLDNGIPFLANGTPADVPLSRNYADPNVNRGPVAEYAVKLIAVHEFSDDWKLRLVYNTEYVSSPSQNAQYYAGDADSSGNLQRFGFTENYFKHWTHQIVVDLTGTFETFGIKHTTVVGMDYYHLNGAYDANFYAPASINIYAPVYDQPYTPPDPSQDFFVTELQNAFGLYAQDQMELPGSVYLLAGFRYDDTTSFDSGYGNAASKVHDTPSPTPRLGALWQPVQQLSLYASYTENYGATALGALTPDGKLLPAESAQQIEVGVKAELLDKKLSVTASAYDLTKQHVPTADPQNPAFVVAIGAARSRGLELDISGEILPGWQVIGGYSYIDGIVTKDDNTPSLAGQPFPGIPKHSASLWSTYEFQSGDLRGLDLGLGVVALGPVAAYESPDGVTYLADRIPGYAIVNAMIGDNFIVGSSVIRAQLNVNNLFDQKFFAAVNPSQATPGTPLSVIGSLSVRF